MNIRRIKAEDGPRLRAIRLAALADAPAAFGSTLAEEQILPAEHWTRYAQEAAASDTSAIFVAEEEARWYGMVRGFVHEKYYDIVRIASMWVDPARRRSGVGAMLLKQVAAWAAERDARRLQLWVTETNHAARTLYARQGFVDTTHTKPLPSNPALQEVLMVRELL
jgi:GNAT superfamily N-acetyltransferase